MDLNTLYLLVPIVAIAGGITYSCVRILAKARTQAAEITAASNDELRKLISDTTTTNAKVVEQLTEIDLRLKSVEKTLTDIP
jgi:cell division protein FtsL